MVDLIKEISELDKKRIINYIDAYGVPKDIFIGIDEYLSRWSKNKQTLYHLLGDKLIVKVPYEEDKAPYLIKDDCNRIINNYWHLFDNINDIYLEKLPSEFKKEFINVLGDLKKPSVYYENEINHNFKIKLEGKNLLQISAGMKPIKVINKMMNYFAEDFSAKDFKEYEDFRIQISKARNDIHFKCNLVFSIHPLDFLTMSDNGENWSSCMSWVDEGCYHTGTVEMLNSNNVICCYLEAAKPYFFHPVKEKAANKDTVTIFKSSEADKDLSEWNWEGNKRWRSLVYATKEIICSGKSYPYHIDDLSKTIISYLRDMAKENLKWEYEYGIELYKDMKNMSGIGIEKNKEWISLGLTKKHNIIFESEAMYNDMVNDHHRNYWCCRNKVKKNTIIKYSGKANCICCNKDLTKYNYDWDDYDNYNDRYSPSEQIICDDCYSKYRCYECGNIIRGKQYRDPINNQNKHIYCKKCFSRTFKKCLCGKIVKPYYSIERPEVNVINKDMKNFCENFPNTVKEVDYDFIYDNRGYHRDNETIEDKKRAPIFSFFACEDCIKEMKNQGKIIYMKKQGSYAWESTKGYYWSKIDSVENKEIKERLEANFTLII